MRDKQGVTKSGAFSGGSGLVTAGLVIAAVIAAGTYLGLRDPAVPTQEDLTALVPTQQAPEESDVSTSAPETAQQGETTTLAPEQAGTSVGPEATSEPADPPAETAETSPTEPETETAQAETPEGTPPSIDEVRLDNDGVAVVAGRATPGSQVRVLVDGQEVARAVADQNGSFAAVGFVEPGEAARILSLEAVIDGARFASLDEVILAPAPAAPSVVAEAAPAEAESATPLAATEQLAETAPAQATEAAEQAAEAAEQVAETVAETTEQMADTVTEQAAEAAEQVAEIVTEQAAEAEEQVAETAEATSDAATTTVAQAAQEPAEQVIAAAPQQAEQPRTAAEPEGTTGQVEETGTAAAAPAPALPTTAAPSEEPAPAEETVSQTEAPAPADAPQTPRQPAVAVLKSDEEGVSLLQTAPASPGNVVLDTISYSDIGVVQLAGRASEEARAVRVYLDNRAVITLRVDAEGNWRGEVPNVDAGVYTLRVDAVDAAGDVTSRLETPFKREAPAVLAEATAAQEGPVKAITVQTGDTLWAIARDRYGEGVLYVRVFEANRTAIRDPDLIYPGQVFDLPDN